MTPLIDADILLYEIGFAAEVAWKHITEDEEAIPNFDFVKDILHQRVDYICNDIGTTSPPILFVTEGRTFRYDVGKLKPYKGTRLSNKPWHYNNLKVYMKVAFNTIVVTEIEADDAISIQHVNSGGRTIICSRDKDLRQVPGMFYSWELGKQPSFGPAMIYRVGSLTLSEGKQKKITGTGLAFFYSQVLTGDIVDNIPGLPKCGPVKAYELLNGKNEDEQLEAVINAYQHYWGQDWEEQLIEQGILCWLLRKNNDDGTLAVWEIGMKE